MAYPPHKPWWYFKITEKLKTLPTSHSIVSIRNSNPLILGIESHLHPHQVSNSISFFSVFFQKKKPRKYIQCICRQMSPCQATLHHLCTSQESFHGKNPMLLYLLHILKALCIFISIFKVHNLGESFGSTQWVGLLFVY